LNDQQRTLAEAVVRLYTEVEPLEKRIRRTDWLLAASAVATFVLLAVGAQAFTGYWVSLYVASAGAMGVAFGATWVRIHLRRQAFAALQSAHEDARLELAYHDDDAR
jgi:hypothetical protein